MKIRFRCALHDNMLSMDFCPVLTRDRHPDEDRITGAFSMELGHAWCSGDVTESNACKDTWYTLIGE